MTAVLYSVDWRGDSMRIVVGVLSFLMLAACQTTSQHFCTQEGFKEGTPEFRECVADQRAKGSVQIEEQAGSGL